MGNKVRKTITDRELVHNMPKEYEVRNCRHHPDYCPCFVNDLIAELILRRQAMGEWNDE